MANETSGPTGPERAGNRSDNRTRRGRRWAKRRSERGSTLFPSRAVSFGLIAAAALSGAALLAAQPPAAAGAPTAAQDAPLASAGTPRCKRSGLVVWLDTAGSGAAGSVYYELNFTNLSGHACTLSGYPGVSAVNLRSRQVGRAAARSRTGAPHTVTLANGETASATLQITDVGNFPAAKCRPRTAAGLRVYPPNATRSKVVPFPFGACTRTSGPVFLHVEAVT